MAISSRSEAPGPACCLTHLTDHDRIELLLEVGWLVAEQTDFGTALRAIAQLVAARTGEYCIVELSSWDGPEVLAVEHPSAARAADAREIRRRFSARSEERPRPGSVGPSEAVLFTNLSDGRPSFGGPPSDLIVTLERELGVTSAIVAPIRGDGHTIGTITLASVSHVLDPIDRRLLEDIGARAGRVVERESARDKTTRYEVVRRAHRRLDILSKATERLASSIDYETTLRQAASAALPALADHCIVDVVEGEGIRRAAYPTGAIRTAPRVGAIVSSVLETCEPQVFTEVDREILADLSFDEGECRMLEELGITSVLVAPLLAPSGSIGAMTFCLGSSGRRYEYVDLELAGAVARRAAISIQHAKAHKHAREAAQRAEDATRRFERVTRVKDEFLGVVSHELRTPLHAVLGWAQLLRGHSGNNARLLEKGLSVIDRNARAQARLIDDILDMSRLITGKLRLDLRPVDLEQIVQATLAVTRPAADAKGLVLVSASRGPVIVAGDPDRLRQVLENLLSNALKFTPQGGRVEIQLRSRGSMAILEVCDTGCGIEPDFLPYVFDRFRQADSSSTRRHGGLGLGLALVRHLVELHGGTVGACEGPDGRGAIFTVQLPLRTVDAANALPLGSTTEPELERRSLSRLDGLRVLVVDDEADGRELVGQILSTAGAEVLVAGSAGEALSMFAGFGPDVLVSDIGMPGQDGYTLIRAVRGLGGEAARLPAVALTAFAGADEANRAVSAGFHSHVPKPAEPSALTAVVARLGGRSSG